MYMHKIVYSRASEPPAYMHKVLSVPRGHYKISLLGGSGARWYIKCPGTQNGGVGLKFPMVLKLAHVHRRGEGVAKISFVGDPRILKILL